MSDSGRWIELALEDEKMAKLAFREKLYNQVCFHCQQGAEKFLKAFLLEKDGRFPKIHSLTELLILASSRDQDLINVKNDYLYLDQFYVPTRYPDAPLGNLPEGSPNQEDARHSLSILERIKDMIYEKLSK